MAARRCVGCKEPWPDEKDYGWECPECGRTLYLSKRAEAMDGAEAHSRMRHAEFERWLVENDRLGPAKEPEELEAIPVREKAA